MPRPAKDNIGKPSSYGHPHPKKKPSNPKNLKKTTKVGAYKQQAKKNFQIRRAPFVETKRRVHAQISSLNKSSVGVPSANYQDTLDGLFIPNNDAFTMLNLASYYRQSHGFEDHNTIGDSIYSKYLKLKIQIRFPEGSSQIVNPVKVYLITGWCTAPMNLTNNTAITEALATQTDLFAHITNQLKQYFDEREDFLRFREKTQSNIKILSWKQIKPELSQISAPPAQVLTNDSPQVIRTTGAPPMVNRSFTWKTMKKMHLSEGKSLATGNDAPSPDTQNLYPNNQWLPFAIIYNPEFARMRDVNNEDTKMTIAYNDIHYYSDS